MFACSLRVLLALEEASPPAESAVHRRRVDKLAGFDYTIVSPSLLFHPSENVMSTNPFDAFGPGGFDRNSEEPARGYEPLPPGKYPVQILKTEVKPTKAGNGSYLWLEMEIFDGPMKGRKVFSNLNLDNPNEQAVKIARKELSAILYAVELVTITHPDQLVNRWMYVSVRVKNDQNDVNGYYHPQDPVIIKYLTEQASKPAPTSQAAYAPPAAPAAAYAAPPAAAPVASAPAAYQPQTPPTAQPVYQPQAAPPVAAPPMSPPAQAAPPYAPPAAAPPAAAPPVQPASPAAPPAAVAAVAPPPAQTAGKPPWA